MLAATASRPNPYVGPRSFKTGEKLYGREREAHELVDLLIAERIVLLYSPSGAGKSSLLNASILPALQAEGFNVLPPLRVNLEPPPDVSRSSRFNRYLYSVLASLDDPLPQAQQLPPAMLSLMPLAEYLERRPKPPGMEAENFSGNILIFDQFEEILTLDPTDTAIKQEFFAKVGQALRDNHCWALFAMREDYVAALDPYLRALPTRLANTYRLDLLTADAARVAMQAPAATQGVAFTEEAAQRLIDDLRRTQTQAPDGSIQEQLGLYIEPVQLQVVCFRLWQNLPADDVLIEPSDVETLGSVDTALGDYYADRVAVVAQTTQTSERAIREWFQHKLITPQGFRGQVLLGRTQTEGLNNKAVRALESAYLVRSEKRGGAIWFELAHDRMIKPVQQDNAQWLEANLSEVQRRADLWSHQNRPDGLLLRDQELVEGEAWAKAHAAELTEIEKEFMEVSRRLQTYRENFRRTNNIIKLLAVVATLVSLVAIFFFSRAQRQSNISYARQVAAGALSSLAIDPELSTLLALEALNEEIDGRALPEAEDALHRSLEALRLQLTFHGHQGEVLTCSFAPEGFAVITGGVDRTAKVWGGSDGQIRYNITEHTDNVIAAIFNHEGTLFATGSTDGTLVLWDANTGQKLTTLTPNPRVGVGALAFSPDDQYLAVGLDNGQVTLWDVAQLKLQRTFGDHTDIIRNLTFSPDGQHLVTASDDHTAKVWAVQTGALLHTIFHDYYVLDAAFSPDGAYLAVASADRTVTIHHTQPLTATPILTFTEHTSWVWGVAFSPDGRYLASASADRFVHLWDPLTGKGLLTLAGHQSEVYDVSFAPNGHQLVSCGKDGTARIWNISHSRDLLTLAHTDKVYGTAYSPDGQHIATSERSNQAYIWNADTGQQLLTLVGHTDAVESVFYNATGTRLATASRDGTAKVWDAATGRLETTLVSGEGWLFGAVFNPQQDTMLATASINGAIELWDIPTGTLLKTLHFSGTHANSVAFSPDGLRVIGAYGYGVGNGAANNKAEVWDINTGQVVFELAGHAEEVNYAVYSPDNRYIATGGEDGLVIVWDAQTGTPLFTFNNHRGGVYGLVFTHDSLTLASASGDKTIKLWDVNPASRTYGQERLSLVGHGDRVYALDFSPRDDRLISSSADNTARLYLLDIEALRNLAYQRLTRDSFLPNECQQFYLRLAACPQQKFDFWAWLLP